MAKISQCVAVCGDRVGKERVVVALRVVAAAAVLGADDGQGEIVERPGGQKL